PRSPADRIGPTAARRREPSPPVPLPWGPRRATDSLLPNHAIVPALSGRVRRPAGRTRAPVVRGGSGARDLAAWPAVARPRAGPGAARRGGGGGGARGWVRGRPRAGRDRARLHPPPPAPRPSFAPPQSCRHHGRWLP